MTYLKVTHVFQNYNLIHGLHVIIDQYYENDCYHITMASEGKDLVISYQHFVDSRSECNSDNPC